jgi:hypothetical protein
MVHAAADGAVAHTWQPEALVQLDDGPPVRVPPERLHRHGGVSYTLLPDPAELEDQQIPGSTISGYLSWRPIMAEEPGMKKPSVEAGRADTSQAVHRREGIVDEPLCREDMSIVRVPVHGCVDRGIPVRYEGDTMIVPLLEARLAVEDRLMSKEKLRPPGRQLEAHLPVGVTLRREEATVEPSRINKRTRPRGE